jgi:hypothetical protein
VRGRAATGGQHALRGGHAVEVVGAGLDADEDDLLALAGHLEGAVGVEDGLAHGRAGRGVEAGGDRWRLLLGLRVELVAQQLVDVGRLDPGQRLLLADDALLDHVGGDAHGGGGGALARARLEHVQRAALDGELEVLHVAVVALERPAISSNWRVDLGHPLAHVADVQRRADAGDHVLALGVGQVLAEEHLLAGVGVAREGHAGARVVAHVAEDHGHDVDRRAQVVGDLVEVAVVARALAEPAGEDGLDGQVELLVRVLGKSRPVSWRTISRNSAGDLAQGGGIEVGVLLHAALVLRLLPGLVEAVAVDAHHDPAEHLDEAPVGVPAEALVAGQR